MKIGILTQPLQTNYGGLLQAYALQRVLCEMGHEAWMVRFASTYGQTLSFPERLRLGVRKAVKKVISPSLAHPDAIAAQRTESFVQKYIRPRTAFVHRPEDLADVCLEGEKFEGYVVGSDQVWRPCYSPYVAGMFLDFARLQQVRRVAYSASFGVDEWEFSKEETAECAALAQLFDAISVREKSGVDLCRKYLHVDASHVLDPTLLLKREDYETLVRNEDEPQRPGNFFCYLFDQTSENMEVVNAVAETLQLTPFETKQKCQPTWQNLRRRREDCICPSVTAWLRSFMDADFVLTDSFHGCVFSIIFNKPFITLGSESRGQARFLSLLKMFGIEERLYTGWESIVDMVRRPIDWEKVNALCDKWREKSFSFLHQSLQE